MAYEFTGQTGVGGAAPVPWLQRPIASQLGDLFNRLMRPLPRRGIRGLGATSVRNSGDEFKPGVQNQQGQLAQGQLAEAELADAGANAGGIPLNNAAMGPQLGAQDGAQFPQQQQPTVPIPQEFGLQQQPFITQIPQQQVGPMPLNQGFQQQQFPQRNFVNPADGRARNPGGGAAGGGAAGGGAAGGGAAAAAGPEVRPGFGPIGPTPHDLGNQFNRAVAMQQFQQFMNAPQRIADQLNASFDRSANRNLVLNNQRLALRGLNLKDKQNRRVVDAIRSMMGNGGGQGGPIPPGVIQGVNSALRNTRPRMSTPALSKSMAANISMRAPDLERTLTPANRSIGLAMDQQRLANVSPLLRYLS